MPTKEKRRRVDTRAVVDSQGGFEPTCVKPPDGYEMCRIENKKTPPGVHAFDFMPYVCGKFNPDADEGFEHFQLTYRCHSIPRAGSDQRDKYICAVAQPGPWKKKCAVCDWVQRHRATSNPELIESLSKLSTKILSWLNDKPGDASHAVKKSKLFDANFFGPQNQGFGQQLKSLITNHKKYEGFWHPENGMEVNLTTSSVSFRNASWTPVTRIDFMPRDKQYPEDIAERMPSLESCLVPPNYDKIWAQLETGTPDDEVPAEKEPEAPKERAKNPRKEEPKVALPEDEYDDTPPPLKTEWVVGDLASYEDHEECEILRISQDGKTVSLEIDGKVVKGVSIEDLKPVPTPESVAPKKVALPEDEEEDDDELDDSDEDDDDDLEDEDDDDDIPPPKKRK
jgi:hypothetical protein